MSVLINGMEMPPNCFLCNLSYMKGERLFCSAIGEEVIRAKRAIECPLIELPPHGRLIDADALPWENQGLMLTDPEDEWGLAWDIEHAPTIIPAEEE